MGLSDSFPDQFEKAFEIVELPPEDGDNKRTYRVEGINPPIAKLLQGEEITVTSILLPEANKPLARVNYSWGGRNDFFALDLTDGAVQLFPPDMSREAQDELFYESEHFLTRIMQIAQEARPFIEQKKEMNRHRPSARIRGLNP
jgi:hypothetical protein